MRLQRAFFTLLVGIGFVASASHVNAQSATSIMATGFAWLQSQVKTDGTLLSETNSVATPLQARVESYLTIKQLGTPSSALPDSVANESDSSTEYLSRKILVLAAAGRDTSALVTKLIASQNLDGGFGIAPGYQSGVLDTAFAILAFKASVNSANTAVTSALGYLSGNANTDGGYGGYGQSTVYSTSLALQALMAFSQSNPQTAPALAAKSFLVGAQVNGTYASVQDNASAITALAIVSSDSSAFTTARVALISAQLADGSWNGDPFLTALALRALSAVASAPPTTGTVNGIVVDDISGVAISNVQVQITGPQNASATTDANGSFTSPALLAGAYTVQISKSGYATLIYNLSLTAGSVANLGTVRLHVAATTATLQGQIKDGTTNQPIANAMVSVAGGASATTDATGHYQVTGLTPGTISISVSANGYQSVAGTGTVVAGETLTFSPSLYSVGQTPTDATLKGKVVSNVTGLAIAGATVTSGAARATTITSGDFQLNGLTAGATTIQIAAPGYVTQSVSATLALGINDAGTLKLNTQAPTLKISGRITDMGTGIAIGGAGVRILGTSFAATTAPDGSYQVTGVDRAQFTVQVSAPGYLSKTVVVTLASIADTTLNATLDRARASGLSFSRIAPNATSYAPFQFINILATVQNSNAQPASLVFIATLFNSAGIGVLNFGDGPLNIAGNAGTQIVMDGTLGALPAGAYSVLTQGYDESGVLQVEGGTSITVNAVSQIGGEVAVDPPVTQAETNQPVNISAKIANLGNQPLTAGPVQVTVTLDTADTTAQRFAETAITPTYVGKTNFAMKSAVMDGQGNLYALGRTNFDILKITPDGQTTTYVTLPYSFPQYRVFPQSLAIDAAGVLYVLNSSQGITKINLDKTLTPIVTSLPNQQAFQRDASGNTYIVTGNFPYQLIKIDPAGVQTVLMGTGLAQPYGIALAADGTYYVSSYAENAVVRVDASGQITTFATGLSGPQGLAVDSAGNLYVANSSSNNIVRISSAGTKSVFATGLNSPKDLSFDTSGNLFVTNLGDNSVSKVLPNGTVSVFTRSINTAPESLVYDRNGNLYVGGASVSKLDSNDNVTSTATRTYAAYMAANAAGDLYSTDDNFIYRVTGGAGVFYDSMAATAIAFDGGGALYAANVSYPRISTPNGTRFGASALQSLIGTNSFDMYSAPNGDLYVLSATILNKLAANGVVTTVASGGVNATSLAPSGDGFFYLKDSSAVYKTDAAGRINYLFAIPTSTPGMAVNGAGGILLADYNGSRVMQYDAAGHGTPFAALPAKPTSLIDDGVGGLYVSLMDGSIVAVSSTGLTTAIASIPGAVNINARMALDRMGNRLYVYLNSSVPGVSVVDLTARAVSSFLPNTPLGAIGFANGQFLAADATPQLRTYSNQGALVSTFAGFQLVQSLVWDSGKFYFNDANYVYSYVPGQNPQRLAVTGTTAFSRIAASAGVIFGTSVNTVYRIAPGASPLASQAIFTLPGANTLMGIAVRADGAMTIANRSDGHVVTISPSGQLLASYAGINNPQGIAIDSAGQVYLTNISAAQIVKIDATGKQSSIFAANAYGYGMTFNSAGQLYVSTATPGNVSRSVSRFNADGTSVVIGSPASGVSATFGPLVVTSTGKVVVTERGTGTLMALDAGVFKTFAGGLSAPQDLRRGSDGALYVSNSNNGTISKFANGQLTTLATGIANPASLMTNQSDRLFYTTSDSHLGFIDPNGVRTDMTMLSSLTPVAISFPPFWFRDNNDQLNVATVASDSQVGYIDQLFKVSYTPPPTPSPGAVMFSAIASAPAIPVGATAATVHFGSFVPPYGGDYKVAVTSSVAGVAGQVTNVLHVGAGASAQMSTNKNRVPPGTSKVGVSIGLKGGDFTSFSKVDFSRNKFLGFGGNLSAMGADAAGNFYYMQGGGNVITRIAPSQIASTFFTSPAPQLLYANGTIPVDSAQNLYIASDPGRKNLLRISPQGIATVVATLPDAILSIVRDSLDNIYALATNRLYKIPPTGAVTSVAIAPTSGALVIDGRDNLYNFTGFFVLRLHPDGSTSVAVDFAAIENGWEGEGTVVAGDCANNLLITQAPPGGEETGLLEFVGHTGKLAQVFNLAGGFDAAALSFDRFSSSLLYAQNNYYGGAFSRIPVTCGAISTDLHVIFPQGQNVSGLTVAPTAIQSRPDGSQEYVFSMKDVTAYGASVQFDTTLANMVLGESRPAAKQAFLAIRNSFTSTDLTIPVSIPSVGVDSLADITVITDHPSYGANADVVVGVQLSNRDTSVRTGKLTVQLTDAQGTLISQVVQPQVTLPATAATIVNQTFNIGTLLVGTYTAKAVLVDPASGSELARAGALFDVVTVGQQLLSSVNSDKQAYAPYDTVRIDGTVKNLALNALASNLTLTETITDASGAVVFTGTAVISQLAPTAYKTSYFAFKLGAAASGSYQIRQVLTDSSGAQVENRTAVFALLSTQDTGTGLQAAVSATPFANQGDPVVLTATIRNQGNASLDNLPLTFKVLSPQPLQVVKQWTLTTTLPQAQQQQFQQTWDTTGVPGGVYVAVVSAAVGGRDIVLGQDNVQVGALVPVAFSAQSGVPLNSLRASNTVTIAGLAAPAVITLVGGQYSLNGAPFTGAAGTVKNGDTLTLQQTSSASAGITTTTVVNIAGTSFAFNVTTVVADTTPDTFGFSAGVDAPIGTLVTSNAVTITGINMAVAVSIVGGQYSINGAPFTNAADMLVANDTLVLRQTSASGFSTRTTATITVGTVSATFDVTTLAATTTPGPFAFTPQTGVALNAVATSNTVVVTAINTSVAISIVGGTYSVNGAAYTAQSGTVKAGDQVTVRQTASALFSTKSTATLKLSNVSANFDVTTLAAITTPGPFSFVPVTNAAVNSTQTSNAITVGAINTAVPVLVVGGTYSINGGPYTAAASSVNANDVITLRQNASAQFSTKTTATLTISAVSAGFDVTTVAARTTPDPIVFVAQTNVPVSTVVTSNTATVSGLDVAVPLTIAGGTYSLNGGAYTSVAGTIKSGDTIAVRLTSSSMNATKTTVGLTIGSTAFSFDVTTTSATTTPNPFGFTAVTNAPVNSVQTANVVTITGISIAVPISIVGGSYSINGGTYTAAAGSVNPNDRVSVRQTVSAQLGTKTTATLTVGGVSAGFDVTTIGAITTPDPFSFVAQSDTAPNAVITSNTVVISGINTPVPISITGGTYSVNGAAYTSSAGTVKAGDSVTVRLITGANYSATTTAVVTVSQFNSGFSATTLALPAPVLTPSVTGTARVLVLLSCKNAQGNDDDSCVATRRTFLADYLGALGVDYKIDTDTNTFQSDLRCGRFNTYWIAGGADKLKGTLPQELREAVFRGDALIVDGMHDQRNADLDEISGIRYKGKSTQSTAVFLTGTVLPSGSFVYSGDAIRVDLLTGVQQAGFGSAGGDAAIVSDAFGLGHAMQFTFDLVATLQAQPTAPLLRTLLTQSLIYLAPIPVTSATGDAYVTLKTTLNNPATIAQDFDVIATLPTGVQLQTANPVPTTQTTSSLTWRVTVGAGQTLGINWDVRVPATSGTYNVTLQANRIAGGNSTPVASSTLPIIVAAADQGSGQTVAALQALTFSANAEKKARDDAVAALQNAQTKVTAGKFEAAIADYLAAGDSLDKVTSQAVTTYQVAIDRLLQESQRSWCRTATSCPISTAAPTGYNVTVFSSASLANGESFGSIGVGGAANLSTYAVASHLYGDTARLIAGGGLTFDSGSVGQNGSGVIRAAGPVSVSASVGRSDLKSPVTVEDWVALKTQYLTYADQLAARSGQNAVANSSNTFTCSGSNASWNVCSVSGSQLTSAKTLNLNFPDTASVLVNVTGTAANLSNGQANWNGQPLSGNAAAARVIFNFAPVSGLTISGFGLGGTILAPRASLTHNNSTIDGPVIVNTLSSTGSYRCAGTFQGVVPN